MKQRGSRITAWAVPLCGLALLAGRTPVSHGADRNDDQRPNIVVVVTDDLGYGDLGCFGQQTVQTPNLDQLAREGMRLTDFYAGNTVCRPSRLVLWTGRHPGHQPINDNQPYVFRPDDDLTFPALLQQAGYVTGGFGKWAMGRPETPGHPLRNGFDRWFGYLDQGEAHNYYPTHLWNNHEQFELAGNELLDDPKARGRVARTKKVYAHDLITNRALQFVREHAEQPFLCHIHWTIPHANNEAGRVLGDGMEVPDYGIYQDRRWPNPEKGFAAMVSRMDRDVGKLMALLRELKIDHNTVVLFTSDNGPHQEGGHRHAFFDSNGPFRGFKRDLHEGGIRVPTIAWWPGSIAAGRESAEPLAFWDVFPTACELAGLDTSQIARFPGDGLSFAPLLQGQTQPSHEYLFFRFNRNVAVRAGKWKAVRTGPDADWELYDLSWDAGESHDLAQRFPERVARLASFAEHAEATP